MRGRGVDSFRTHKKVFLLQHTSPIFRPYNYICLYCFVLNKMVVCFNLYNSIIKHIHESSILN